MTFKPGAPLPEPVACSWCGLRIAVCSVSSTPTCAECRDGGKSARVRASLARWKRGQERKRDAG